MKFPVNVYLAWCCGAVGACLTGAALAQPPGLPASTNHAAPEMAKAVPVKSWTSPKFKSEVRDNGVIYVAMAVGAVNIYTKSIPNQLIGQITTGLCDPGGLALDANATLYVANQYGCFDYPSPSINVYPAGQTTPSLTIIKGMYDPIFLAVSAQDQTIYASDYGFNILEYAAGQTSLENIVYPRGAFPRGVALDQSNALYASYQLDFNHYGAKPRFRIGKYDAATHNFDDLGIKIEDADAIAFDSSNRLAVADFRTNGKGRISVYQPGSTTPYKVFHGFSDPYAIAFDPDGEVLYVADNGTREIDELSYPDGKKLGAITGFTINVFGVAVSPPTNQLPHHEAK